jgi:hypothetical protein
VRIAACVTLGVLATTLLCVQEYAQRAKKPGDGKEKNVFASNQFFAKGGIGIIDQDLYIVVKSAKNELIFSGANKWLGLDASQNEVVIFFEGKILGQKALPDRFDLSKAVVISFEGNKVRFFDFRKMSGGYYSRPGTGSD